MVMVNSFMILLSIRRRGWASLNLSHLLVTAPSWLSVLVRSLCVS